VSSKLLLNEARLSPRPDAFSSNAFFSVQQMSRRHHHVTRSLDRGEGVRSVRVYLITISYSQSYSIFDCMFTHINCKDCSKCVVFLETFPRTRAPRTTSKLVARGTRLHREGVPTNVRNTFPKRTCVHARERSCSRNGLEESNKQQLSYSNINRILVF
jgi:hypothetical protein